MSTPTPPALDWVHYETMPFGAIAREAAGAPHPLTLTVTCSPKHGNDLSVESAAALRREGHGVIVHLAARMVRSREHLDELLSRMLTAGIRDVFLVGGDHAEPMGPYARAVDLLPVLRSHPDGPRSIGIPGYPEGHPWIPGSVLLDDLKAKAAGADYITTQLCFHPSAILHWLQEMRATGITLPVYIGLPGIVDRRRLLEISLRVGVGASISFLRKQHGFAHLAGRGHSVAEHLHAEVAPLIGSELGVSGLHMFTFNRLLDTVRFVELRSAPFAQVNLDGQR